MPILTTLKASAYFEGCFNPGSNHFSCYKVKSKIQKYKCLLFNFNFFRTDAPKESFDLRQNFDFFISHFSLRTKNHYFAALIPNIFMNSGLLKKLLPHVVAIVVFLVITAIFCKPSLEGNVLNQHDITGWKGMAQNAFEYKAKHGHYPLWNPNLFSGMPNYQVALQGKSIL